MSDMYKYWIWIFYIVLDVNVCMEMCVWLEVEKR